MNTKFKNDLKLAESTFWKSFLHVFFLYYIIELGYISVVWGLFKSGMSYNFILSAFFWAVIFLLQFSLVSSFFVTYSIEKRLINKNPEKVFTVGLINLSLFFFVVQIFLGLYSIFLGNLMGLSVSIFWITHLIISALAVFIWLYLSTLWLYKRHSGEKLRKIN